MGKGQSQQGKNLELQVRHCSRARLGGPDGPDGQRRWSAARGDWAVLTWVRKSPVATGPCWQSALPRFHNARLETSSMLW